MASKLSVHATAEVEGTDYAFDISAETIDAAYATADEHLELIAMPEWKDKLILNFKEES